MLRWSLPVLTSVMIRTLLPLENREFGGFWGPEAKKYHGQHIRHICILPYNLPSSCTRLPHLSLLFRSSALGTSRKSVLHPVNEWCRYCENWFRLEPWRDAVRHSRDTWGCFALMLKWPETIVLLCTVCVCVLLPLLGSYLTSKISNLLLLE